MARRAGDPGTGGSLYRFLWDAEEARHQRFGRVGNMRRPTYQRDRFRRGEPVVVDGGSFPSGMLPRGSGGKYFVVTPDDQVTDAVYGRDHGPIGQGKAVG
ncbi:hypothetical protein ABQF17_17965 [Mycolicibacterium elephantis]